MAEFGVSAALLTPFGADGAVDHEKLAEHACDLVARGLDGVTLFGTTGENASIAATERVPAIRHLIGAGIDTGRIVLGLCASAVADVAVQVREGLDAGIVTFLLPPPFYFKEPGDDGLFDWHAAVFAAAGRDARFIPYHIPQITGVSLTKTLISRLDAAFPGRIRAIKDSSGDWATAEGFLAMKTHPILVGDERLLARAVSLGGAGAISGVANLYPERMLRIVETATEDAALSEEVTRICAVPVIPALKVLLAAQKRDTAWENLRPPFSQLASDQRDVLLEPRTRAASGT